MEGDTINTNQAENVQTPVSPATTSTSLPKLSFIPSELIKETSTGPLGMREKCALAGVALGVLAVFSWIVILFGVFMSVAGIVLSVLGLRSTHSRYARVGLALSVLGLIFSIWYVFAAYSGMINYNYFTSEFWEATSGVEKGTK